MKVKLLFVLVPLLLLLSFNINAESMDAHDYITGEMEQVLPDGILEGDGAEGNVLNYKSLVSLIGSFFKASLSSVLKSFFSVISLVIISALFGMLCSCLKGYASQTIFSYISSVCFAVLLYGIMDSLWNEMSKLFSDIHALMNGISPSVTLMYAMGGNITGAAVSNAGMSIVLTVFQDICFHGLRPILQICFGFSIISCLSGNIDLAPMAKFVRSVYTTVLVFVISVMTCIMSAQNVLAGAGDGLAMRAVRFASSTAIPIVGGALSEATAQVTRSIGALRASFGILAIIALAVMVLPTLISLWVNKLSFSLGGAVCSVFGLSRESSIISSAAELINFALAITFAVSLMFVINLTLFSNAAVALGG